MAESLGGFTRLRHFEVEGFDRTFLLADSLEKVGDVGTLDFWARRCQSLHRVTLFEADLP